MRVLLLLAVLLFSYSPVQLLPDNGRCDQNSRGIKIDTDKTARHALKDTTPVSSWEVKGCAAKATKAVTKFSSPGENVDYPDLRMPGEEGITAAADSIIYSRFVRHGCCRKASVSIQQQGNTLNFVEYWTGSICKCMCSSTIRAVIKKLPPGEYKVFAIETGTNPLDDKPNSGRDTLIRQKLLINE